MSRMHVGLSERYPTSTTLPLQSCCFSMVFLLLLHFVIVNGKHSAPVPEIPCMSLAPGRWWWWWWWWWWGWGLICESVSLMLVRYLLFVRRGCFSSVVLCQVMCAALSFLLVLCKLCLLSILVKKIYCCWFFPNEVYFKQNRLLLLIYRL